MLAVAGVFFVAATQDPLSWVGLGLSLIGVVVAAWVFLTTPRPMLARRTWGGWWAAATSTL